MYYNQRPHTTWAPEREPYLANGQPFKLLGITYLVEKIKFQLLFQGPLAKQVR